MTNSLSIIAYNPESNQLGGGLLTHTFGACRGIIYIEPGVGIVASQAASGPFYAFAGLELMQFRNMSQMSYKRCDICHLL
jgi:uncharacterized Ntn-hydrolase superfamily protein